MPLVGFNLRGPVQQEPAHPHHPWSPGLVPHTATVQFLRWAVPHAEPNQPQQHTRWLSCKVWQRTSRFYSTTSGGGGALNWSLYTWKLTLWEAKALLPQLKGRKWRYEQNSKTVRAQKPHLCQFVYLRLMTAKPICKCILKCAQGGSDDIVACCKWAGGSQWLRNIWAKTLVYKNNAATHRKFMFENKLVL